MGRRPACATQKHSVTSGTAMRERGNILPHREGRLGVLVESPRAYISTTKSSPRLDLKIDCPTCRVTHASHSGVADCVNDYINSASCDNEYSKHKAAVKRVTVLVMPDGRLISVFGLSMRQLAQYLRFDGQPQFFVSKDETGQLRLDALEVREMR
jgi:hypothetical protein